MTKPAQEQTTKDKRLAALEKARRARKNNRPLTVAGIKKLWNATCSRNNLTPGALDLLLKIYVNDVKARTRRATVTCLGTETSRITFKAFSTDNMTVYYRKPRATKKKAAAQTTEASA